MSSLLIRPAKESDAKDIHMLLMELAQFEKIDDTVESTHESTHEALFGKSPCAEAIVAEADQTIVAAAVFFHNYSTFVGKRGLYLEDIYVKPKYRGNGIGKEMLSKLAQIAIERNCGRMEWIVLNWNERAIAFYEGIGAEVQNDLKIVRLTESEITRLAGT